MTQSVRLRRSQLQALLQQENLQGAKALLVPVQPADIAQAIEGLPEAMQAIAFRLLSKQEAIEVYEYLDPSVQQSLIAEFKHQDVLDIVDQMSPDDRARLFEELPAKVVRRLLQQLSPEERQATALLLGYKVGTGGRLMTPEYISLKESMTIAQALERIRSLANATEIIYYLYVTDGHRRLTGTLSLRDLVIAQPEQTVSEIMTREVSDLAPIRITLDLVKSSAIKLQPFFLAFLGKIRALGLVLCAKITSNFLGARCEKWYLSTPTLTKKKWHKSFSTMTLLPYLW